MPRKSKKVEETVEVKEEKPKVTRKRKATKAEEPVVEQKTEFNISEILSWSDEECLERDKVLSFKVSDVKNILKSLVSTTEQLNNVTEKFNLLKKTIGKGKMVGYEIMCPHCQRKYVVSSMDLNRTEAILCKVCGTEYKEDEHISGISYVPEPDEEDNKTTVI